MEDSIPAEGLDLTGRTSETEYPERLNPLTAQAVSYLSDPELWENYEDRELAESEQLLRNWIEDMKKVPRWARTNSKARKYTFSMLFELVTGKRYEQKKHACKIRMWSVLFRYYSSRIQKSGYINGKFYSKTVYIISPSRLRKPPYSLRLRIPWLIEHGVTIDRRTMTGQIKEADLRPGHARNPRTEENMRKRHEEGLRRYYERYPDRAHR